MKIQTKTRVLRLGAARRLTRAIRLNGAPHVAIAHSATGAFDPAADGSDALVHRWTTRGATAVYLDSGGSGTCGDPDGDGVFEDSDDRDNFCVTNQLRDHFESLGYTHGADLFHWHEAGAGHNEAAWAARISRGLASCASAGWSVPS